MHSSIIFFFSAIASFTGSLQLGPVNLYVIDTALNQNKKSAIWVSFGGAIPEFIYCALAVYAGDYLMSNPTTFFIFKILLILLLIIIAVIYFLKKYKPKEINVVKSVEYKKSIQFFTKGFGLAILNPQLLPFWVFILVYFNTIYFLNVLSELDKIAFFFGAGFGAFILLIFIVLTINRFRNKIAILINNKYYFKTMAVLFLLIALQQLITLL